MRSHLRIDLRTVATALCGVGLALSVFGNAARADQWDKKTILTVNQPIQVKNNLLQPGTYVFKLLDSQSDRHIVQIYNSDQSHLIDTVLAIPNYRLEPTGDSKFAFWETPPGNAKALRAWFYPGDNYGQEFPRPKHFIRLTAEASVTTTPFPVSTTPTPSVSETTPPVTQPAEPQPTTQEPERQETQPQELAQATPPPQSPAPATPPPASTPPPPESLPKTGSPYPLIGLSGILSLGLFGLLKLRRT